MAKDATQVAAIVTAAVSGVSSSKVITSASDDISGAGTINYGLIGEGGITISTDRSTNKITSLEGNTVRVASQGGVATYKFVLLQNTKEARELFYGSAEATNGEIKWNLSKMPRGRFVFDALDTEWAGDESGVLYIRHDVPRGQVSEIGDIVIKGGEPIGYEVTVTAYPDADGVVAHVWNGTGSTTPGGPTEPSGPPTITLNASTPTIVEGNSFDVYGYVGNSTATQVQVTSVSPTGATVVETAPVNIMGGSFSYSHFVAVDPSNVGEWDITAATLPLGAESVIASTTVTVTAA